LWVTVRLRYKLAQVVSAWAHGAMAIQIFVGRVGLARILDLSEQWVRQLDPPPDALIDGRPAWTLETSARLKVELAARRAERQRRTGKKTRAASHAEEQPA
jgi:hypothetical protein